MKWSDVQFQLTVARDAFQEGRWTDAKALADEVGADIAWVRRTTRRTHPRPYFDDVDDPWEQDGPEPRADTIRHLNAEWKAIDWFAWIDPVVYATSSTLTSLAYLFKQAYPPGVVRGMAMREHPLLSMLRKAP